jgi:hypothetical protein
VQPNFTLPDPNAWEETRPGAAGAAGPERQLYLVRHLGPSPGSAPAVHYVLARNFEDALDRLGKEVGGAVPYAVELIDNVKIHSVERPQCFKFIVDGATHVVISDDMPGAWAHLRKLGVTRSGHWQLEAVRLSEQVLTCAGENA